MQVRASVAAGALALLLGVIPQARADCEGTLYKSDAFEEALQRLGIVWSGDGSAIPTQRPAEKLKFLDLAENAGFEGQVVVMLIIAADGRVADRIVLCARPFGYFEAGVLDWARGFKFAPLAQGATEHYRAYVVTTKFLLR